MSEPSWYLTFGKGKTGCEECGETIPKLATFCFEYPSRRILCEVCADNLGVLKLCVPSRRLKGRRRGGKRRRKRR